MAKPRGQRRVPGTVRMRRAPLLTLCTAALAPHLLPGRSYCEFFELYNRLLASENYVLKRLSLKLLSEFLLDRENFRISEGGGGEEEGHGRPRTCPLACRCCC